MVCCAHAQLNFTFTAYQGTYTPISGGINATLVQAQPPYAAHDEGIANGIPIGFNFAYNDTNYTTISACSNGFASFSTLLPIANPSTEDYYSADLGYGPLRPGARPLLAPLWDDLDLFSATDIKYITTGTAPNRVFTMQWSRAYFDITATELNVEFQLKLYETTNRIQFVYQRLPGEVGINPGGAIGITAKATGPGNYIALSDASASPIASSTTNYFNIKNRPATGQMYEFTPFSPLYINLLKFHGERVNNIHQLTWTTQVEINNTGFEVQRSVDGVIFEKIGYVASKASGGSSTSPIDYNFEDIKPLVGTNYYRLKQIDRNNHFSYSRTILVKGGSKGSFAINILYPNPATDLIKIVLANDVAGPIDIIVADVAGKVYIQQRSAAIAGENHYSIDVAKLAKGMYYLKAIGGDGDITVSKFIK